MFYLPQAVFMAKGLYNSIKMKHNKVKNPSWQEANQLAIYKRSLGVKLGTSGL